MPILDRLGQEKGLAVEARDTLLEILAYDEDEAEIEDAEATSRAIAHNLIETWLQKYRQATEEFDSHARFVQEQIQMILLAFGKRRPKVDIIPKSWLTTLTTVGFSHCNQQIFRGES